MDPWFMRAGRHLQGQSGVPHPEYLEGGLSAYF